MAGRGAAVAVTALSLPGSSGNFASTPDTAANSLTGDFDLRAKLTLADWTPTATMAIASKWASGDRSWRITINDSGVTLSASIDGSGILGSGAKAIDHVDGTAAWVRCTRVASSGLMTIYKSTNGSSWTSIGTTSLASGALYNSGGAVTLGSQAEFSTTMLNGTIHYVELRDGIDGTVVNKYDPSGVTILGTRNPTTLVASTGETWTMNGSTWDWVTV